MLHTDIQTVIIAVDVDFHMIGAGCRHQCLPEYIPADLGADNRGIVVLSVQIELLEPVELSSRKEGVEGNFEGFLGGITRGVAAQAEADRVDRILHRAVLEDESGGIFVIAFHIIVDHFQGIRIDRDIDFGNALVVIHRPVFRKIGLGM